MSLDPLGLGFAVVDPLGFVFAVVDPLGFVFAVVDPLGFVFAVVDPLGFVFAVVDPLVFVFVELFEGFEFVAPFDLDLDFVFPAAFGVGLSLLPVPAGLSSTDCV